LKTIRMRHSPQTTRFAFSSRNGVRFQFTWYQNEISYQNESFIRIENRNELIPEWLVWGRNFVSVSCKQIQRNIWGWNELVLEWKSFRSHVNGPLGFQTLSGSPTPEHGSSRVQTVMEKPCNLKFAFQAWNSLGNYKNLFTSWRCRGISDFSQNSF